MLRICDILTPERIACSVVVPSKKKAFELIAEIFANSLTSLQAQSIFDALVARERLGNTTIGCGAAMPHATLPQVDQVMGCLLLLKKGIDYDTDNHAKVDIFFSLITPSGTNETYFDAFTHIAQLFQDEAILKHLRSATSAIELYQRLVEADLRN